MPLPTPRVWASSLQNWERINFCGVYPVCSNCRDGFRKWIQPGSRIHRTVRQPCISPVRGIGQWVPESIVGTGQTAKQSLLWKLQESGVKESGEPCSDTLSGTYIDPPRSKMHAWLSLLTAYISALGPHPSSGQEARQGGSVNSVTLQ